MPELTTHHEEHRITVDAPAPAVYDLISDVRRWPHTFTPTIHAEQLSRDGDEERIRLWALANGEVKTWTSRRVLDAVGLRVRFRQEITQPPAAAMGGEWIIQPAGDGRCTVVLAHTFQAIDDNPESVAWIRQAVDRNSEAELARLRIAAEAGAGLAELTLSFEDSTRVDGELADVYEFLYQAGQWPRRLPHVARLDLDEAVTNIQRMEMDTSVADGSVHTTRSIRICFPDNRIVYKQTEVPKLMSAHTGEWVLTADGGQVVATSRHTVVIDPAAVPEVLGADATVAQARQLIRKSLGGNSSTTLAHAKAFAERAGD